jgi:hypothetical protein
VAANHTFAGDPTPRIDGLADGGPLAGWIASSGRVAVAAVEHDVALVTYDRQARKSYRVGPNFSSWPKILTVNVNPC